MCSALLASHLIALSAAGQTPLFQWSRHAELPPVGDQSTPLGIAGAIAGISNGALIVAGGANFDEPIWENDKVWHDDIWVLPAYEELQENNWLKAGKLPTPLAYSAVVTTSLGVIAMGGSDGQSVSRETLLFQWDPSKEEVGIEELPPLPRPCVYGSATVQNQKIYLAGGTSTMQLEDAMANFWVLDLEAYGTDAFQWHELPSWPGPERAFNLIATQHNGYDQCLYVMTGRRSGPTPATWEVLKDVYEYNPGNGTWRQKADMPQPRMAGTAATVGQSHVFVLSGADGSLYQHADSLRSDHPGFPGTILGYHTITDTWFDAGQVPANQVTSHLIQSDEAFFLVSGEIKPRTRTPSIWKIEPQQTTHSLGWISSSAIIVYLMLLVAIGWYFARRNKSTEDFFRGGQRIPWWAAGCSIFATMLSSLTFMSIPAKTYATDWLYFFINLFILILAPFIIHYILPFFRRLDATSAYEYLEKRFNLASRLFASTSYILFQIGRMAIVMYLPSLALSTVTPISIETCILLMGVLSILYSTLGGLEAVVWTDTLQTFVLLGGALFSLGLILSHDDIGFSHFIATAAADSKFQMVDFSWDYRTAVLWVVILGGIGQTLIPYTSDQGVVQRYMSVASEQNARQSIWTNAGLSLFATLLFFTVGTALYVFYKQNPSQLDPTYQTDSVFPQFIASQLPAGIAGLVIAGIFAAAQSTVSTSMNSISTAFSTDFVRRFQLLHSEKHYMILARSATVLFGLFGTVSALVIANADVKSLWDSFMGILGLLGGAMCGLFLLGILTARAHGKGAVFGAIAGIISLWCVQQFTEISFLLYSAIGIASTFLFGYLSSLVLPADGKVIDGLTIYTRSPS